MELLQYYTKFNTALLALQVEVNTIDESEKATRLNRALFAFQVELSTFFNDLAVFTQTADNQQCDVKKDREEGVCLLSNKEDQMPRIINGCLHFTRDDIKKMPQSFKTEFNKQGGYAPIRQRSDLRYNCSYEIRYRRNGINASGSGVTVKAAIDHFIANLSVAVQKRDEHKRQKQINRPDALTVPQIFEPFALYFLEKFKWRKVCDGTKRNHLQLCRQYLFPAFGKMELIKILPGDCQDLIDSIFHKGTPKQATEAYSLLNQIMSGAVRHRLIDFNPCDIVFVDSYEKEHGKALSKEEEKTLLQSTAGTPYQLVFALALYCGLRPNEYKSAEVVGEFISAVNSKQKDGKIHYKRIPITPLLRPYLSGVTQIKVYHQRTVYNKFKEILPNHKLYDLRTTLYTRCQECGVAPVARNLFVGHSLKGLEETYTDVSDEYLIKEGEKLVY